jgi:peptidoglycan/xylan/chitin deacetylase (PgdA/CDA1 family)
MTFSLLNKIKKRKKPKAVVLMYHRIANPETDPWQLAVNRENFEQQLNVLKNNYRIITTRDLSEQLADNKLEDDCICITFDDAYTDNYLHAKPLLEKYDCPATFFVPSHFIGADREFWWDELKNIILQTETLPASLSLKIRGDFLHFQVRDELLSDEVRAKNATWVWPEKAPTERCELYFSLWELLQPLTIDEVESSMNDLRIWACYSHSGNREDLPMTSCQLEEILKHPLFDVGIHTLTHQALAFHSREIQRSEIVACKQDLEKRSKTEINFFAYPYGNYNATTLSLVKEENLALSFTTQEKTITSDSDTSLLGRFQVLNQNGKIFKRQLRDWFQNS